MPVITMPAISLDFPIKLSSPVWYTLGILAGTAVAIAIIQNLRIKRHRIKKSLKGKIVVITGGTAGIGKECAKELARQGATIHILARDLKRGESVVNEIQKSTGNKNVFVHFCNLSDLTTVRMFAKKFLATETQIHILINNAGLINMTKKMTIDGLEETCQANYLSHFHLTNLLLERIVSSSPSRIVNVSSLAYDWVDQFDPKDMNWAKRPYNWIQSYSWTKLEMVLWTRELARRTYGKGVTVNCVHPGGVRTSIMRDVSLFSPWRLLTPIGWIFSISPYLGAQTLLYLATSEEVENVSGHYFVNCQPEALNVRALDDQTPSELWWESENLTARMK